MSLRDLVRRVTGEKAPAVEQMPKATLAKLDAASVAKGDRNKALIRLLARYRTELVALAQRGRSTGDLRRDIKIVARERARSRKAARRRVAQARRANRA